jgi:histidyl-tRNA synthetase
MFSFQSWAKADDIKDFQIEGMSVGDSLLDYFDISEVKIQINSYQDKGYIFKHNDFYSLTFRYLAKFKKYDAVQIYLKDKDKNFEIQALTGIKYYKDNIKDCYLELSNIKKSFDIMFENSTRVGDEKKRKHSFDKSGESTTLDYYYYLKENNYEFVSIVCSDWGKKINIVDSFQVQISSYNFGDFLFNKAYK